MTSYDDIAFTAMCMWEWHIENHEQGAVAEYRDIHGACETRCQTIDIARLIDEAYTELYENHYTLVEPFDWGFIPELMERMTLDDYATPTQARIRTLCIEVFEKLQESTNARITRSA